MIKHCQESQERMIAKGFRRGLLGVWDSSVRCCGGGYMTVGLSKSALYTKKNELDYRQMKRKSTDMSGDGMQTGTKCI